MCADDADTHDFPLKIVPPTRVNTSVTMVAEEVATPMIPSPRESLRLAAKPTYEREGHPASEVHWKAEAETTDFLDQYFVGPRDLDRHTKLPHFLRIHGSVMPQMIIPLIVVASWATLITAISTYKPSLGISSLLLTVLGFVVGLALSFRSTTAYERYAEGRKYWALLIQTSRNLARHIWIHAPNREGELEKEDLLKKLSAINLILAFAISLKHRLRFEPHIHHEDLHGLVDYLDTFAKSAFDPVDVVPKHISSLRSAGMYLGLTFCESNPQKLIKRSKKPVGNLPLEVLMHLSAYIEELSSAGRVSPIVQTQIQTALASMNEVLTGTERVLHTPLPAAYQILFSQITWIYVLLLPFQLFSSLQWVTIPATLVAAYIILGIAAIGVELENPFGNDVNDLPLENYCRELSIDLDIMTSTPPPKTNDYMTRTGNKVLFPLSMGSFDAWNKRSVCDIYDALKAKSLISREDKRRKRHGFRHEKS